MGSKSNNKVVMFADVVGSTALYEELGDTEAQRLISIAIDVVKRIAEAHHGVTVMQLGDEAMVVFDDAGDAAATACDIHAKIPERLHTENPETEIRMRIGLHAGPLGDTPDMSSETSKIAHWATSNAKAEQTLATEIVIDNLPRIYQAVSRYVDDETWNFISLEHVTLHEIIWDVEGVTAYAGEQPTVESQRCRSVTFRYMDKEVTVNPDRPVISVGRGKHNDLIIQQDLISRQHFTAQFSRGRCTISDNSTNGSTVYYADGTEQILKKDTLPLRGSGRIIVGQPVEIEDRYCVSYTCA